MSPTLDIYRDGAAHDDVSLGNPDDFVDEGDRWVRILTLTVRSCTTANSALHEQRLNYGSTKGHPNACDGHYMYVNPLKLLPYNIRL